MPRERRQPRVNCQMPGCYHVVRDPRPKAILHFCADCWRHGGAVIEKMKAQVCEIPPTRCTTEDYLDLGILWP